MPCMNSMWRSWFYRLVPYAGRRQAETDLDAELRHHLELERERQRDAGVPDADAMRAARRTLGNATLIRERTREVWSWRWLDELAYDVRHAGRGLRRDPGFAATVVMVLALGIGANTAMFSVVHGTLLRPLPYPDAERIVRVGHVSPRFPGSQAVVSNVTFPQLQAQAESFEHVAGYAPRSLAWVGPEGARMLRGTMVSPSLLAVLGAKPHLGRLFTADDARAGAEPVVLLSYRGWITRFGSDPDVVGAQLHLDGDPFTIVGVLSEGFSFPGPHEELWTPLVLPTAVDRRSLGLAFSGLGLLRRGVSPERAASEIHTILNADRPPSGARPALEARVLPLQEEAVRGVRPALLVLTAVTALILTMACLNVAGLSLARGVTRKRELALRGALGAGRGRIARQLLTESVVLSVAAGGVGLLAATLVVRGLPTLLAAADVPRLHEVGVDGVVLTFAAGLSVGAGLVCGALPAVSWSRLSLVQMLSGAHPTAMPAISGFGRLRANVGRSALVVAQVALALVLLVGAGLLLHSFVRLVSVDPGYDPRNVLTARVSNPDLRRVVLSGEFLPAARTARRFNEALADRLARAESVPGIEAVGLSTALPFVRGGWPTVVRIPGGPDLSGAEEAPRVLLQFASPGYFDVLRLRFRSGRAFTRLDGLGSPRVVIVNESVAREVFHGGACGRTPSVVGTRRRPLGGGGSDRRRQAR